MKTLDKILLVLLPAMLAGALPAAAQQSRYELPGGLGERRLDLFEAIMETRRNARWQVGFLDVEPQVSISDLGYVSNIYSAGGGDDQSDFKGTGLAGLRGFFNLGPKVVVSPSANLSHTWWQEQEVLRSTKETFGVQLLGDFNRLKFLAQAGQFETQRNLSSEVEVPVDLRDDRLGIELDINFRGPFRFFAGASTAERRYFGEAAESNVPGLDLEALEVETEVVNAGFAYQLSDGLEIALGVERAEARYPFDPDGRSNEGTGPLARVSFEGSRLLFEAEAAWRDLEFDARPGEGRQELRGLVRLEWRFGRTLSTGAYGGSQLEASALDSASIFESRRTGVFLQRRGSDRGSTGLFFETGTDDFARIVVDDITRSDDFETWGLNVSFELTPSVRVDLGYFDSRRESTDPRFDRDFSGLRTAIRLGGNLLPW